MFARENLPRIGYKKRIHLMNVLIPGLDQTGQMSASAPNSSKIDFDDSDDIIRKKIKNAYSVDGEIANNGLLAILKYIIFRRIPEFVVERPAKWGGRLIYKTYDLVEKAFVEGELVSADLKPALADELIRLITPLRYAINLNRELLEKAYPK